jgi:G3E family GTPase
MYLTAEKSQARLPVLLLSGFLGSGKTTLVNALLRDPRLANTAVAVNEFGEVPLDAHLIDHGADKTVVMANGCLCCNLAGDMEDAVMRLFSRREAGALPNFARLIIEPSGLSHPAPIAQAILRNPVMARAFRLEGIVTTVDAIFGLRQIDTHTETAKQIFLADRLVITKSDMAEAADVTALHAALKNMNPAAEIFEAVNGEVDPAALLPLSFLDPAAPATFVRARKFADSPSHETETLAISLTAEAPLNWRLFEAWLRKIRLTHAAQLLRVKAILNLSDSELPVVIHGVHHVLHTPTQLPAWPDADRRSRIVLITRGLPRGLIEADWQDSLPGLHAARAA